MKRRQVLKAGLVGIGGLSGCSLLASRITSVRIGEIGVNNWYSSEFNLQLTLFNAGESVYEKSLVAPADSAPASFDGFPSEPGKYRARVTMTPIDSANTTSRAITETAYSDIADTVERDLVAAANEIGSDCLFVGVSISRSEGSNPHPAPVISPRECNFYGQ